MKQPVAWFGLWNPQGREPRTRTAVCRRGGDGGDHGRRVEVIPWSRLHLHARAAQITNVFVSRSRTYRRERDWTADWVVVARPPREINRCPPRTRTSLCPQLPRGSVDRSTTYVTLIAPGYIRRRGSSTYCIQLHPSIAHRQCNKKPPVSRAVHVRCDLLVVGRCVSFASKSESNSNAGALYK